ncbi:MAG: carboxylating nicotinate-nucleotide diphosphorylase [Candidatus Omnitrophica bacterium]|nr:carboxylating nicotinate-nucleotide diphosphorylase [Candidatus Omnitrophota bacterium]
MKPSSRTLKTQPFKLSAACLKRVREAYEEDLGQGDITTDLLVPASARGHARILAREAGVFCGAPVLREVFRLAGPVSLEFPIPEGGAFKKNALVADLRGPVRALLKAERTALNFLAHLSGIAAQTQRFVEAVRGHPVLILDTRKTTPLWRELEKYAVRCGGGKNHRMGLYDAVFVKENHRAFGDLKRLQSVRGRFEIEVRNQTELKDALKYQPRVILFDNFTPARLNQAVQYCRKMSPETTLEASGGMTLENVAHFAAMGVDWISVGALTHSVKAQDYSLLLT